MLLLLTLMKIKTERTRVLSGSIDNAIIYLRNLWKLPYGQGLLLADVFGHLERNRSKLGIAEYSISQSTLETIFNHFAANS
ncbi:hypothetical protein ACFX2A_014576 [Malus domestica]